MKRRPISRLFAALLCACTIAFLLPAPPARAASFSDVPQSHWAAAEIEKSVALGLFKGESASFFGAEHSMTRAAFAVVTSRFFGWESDAADYPVFSDVSADAWYAAQVRACYDHGAIRRESDRFRPNDPVTREEMAVLLVRALGYDGLAAASAQDALPFTDVSAARGYIAVARALGVFNGVTPTEFRPAKTATRAQAAAIFVRLYEKLHPASSETLVLCPPDGYSSALNGKTVALTALTLRGAEPFWTDRTAAQEAVKSIRDAGGKALLCVDSDVRALDADASEIASRVASYVKSDGYDGVLLNVAPARDVPALTALAAALRAALPQGSALLTVLDAPASGEPVPDVTALAAAADRVVLRVAPYESAGEAIPVTAYEPIAAVYA
ncbi:MAG: S-layer homology domain-containing protein, partial [Oscillibacter sp.]|nr:S-layer homology domain-containing protein [Oscillibacter sp.]